MRVGGPTSTICDWRVAKSAVQLRRSLESHTSRCRRGLLAIENFGSLKNNPEEASPIRDTSRAALVGLILVAGGAALAALPAVIDARSTVSTWVTACSSGRVVTLAE